MEESGDEVPKSQLPIGKKPTPLYRLYIRSEKWIKDRDNAEKKLKEFCPRIDKIVFPRQKHHNYVFAHFPNADQRDLAYAELHEIKELHVDHVKADDPELVEKIKKKIEEKRAAKKELKETVKKSMKIQESGDKLSSNKLIIFNLPVQTTVEELRQHFPESIDIQFKNRKKETKGKKVRTKIATITLATPSAAKAFDQKQIALHNSKFKVVLCIDKKLKRKFEAKKKLSEVIEIKDEIKEESEAKDEEETSGDVEQVDDEKKEKNVNKKNVKTGKSVKNVEKPELVKSAKQKKNKNKKKQNPAKATTPKQSAKQPQATKAKKRNNSNSESTEKTPKRKIKKVQ